MLCRIGYDNYDYWNWLKKVKRGKWEWELKTRARWRISASNVIDTECALGLQKFPDACLRKVKTGKRKSGRS